MGNRIEALMKDWNRPSATALSGKEPAVDREQEHFPRLDSNKNTMMGVAKF